MAGTDIRTVRAPADDHFATVLDPNPWPWFEIVTASHAHTGWQVVELLACERSLLREQLVVLPLLNRPFDSGVLKRRTFTYRAQSAVLAPWAASWRPGGQ